MSNKKRLIAWLPVRRAKLIIWTVVSVLLLSNLGAIIDSIFHPDIPYFDVEHIIVGVPTALLLGVMFVFIIIYFERLQLAFDNLSQSEKDLRGSREKIDSLLQNTDQGIYGVDLLGTCTFINRAALDFLGYQEGECIGVNMHTLIHHSFADGTPYSQEDCPILHSMLTGNGCRLSDEVLWRKDGSFFHAEYSSYPLVESGEIRGSVVTFSDISERKQAEKVRLQYSTELEKRVEERTIELVLSNRVKDEFLAMMSHELRTPLTSVLGLSDVLLEGITGPLNEKQKESIQRIRFSGRHLLDVINDVLDLSKIQARKFEIRPVRVGVDEICKASLVFVQTLSSQKNISLVYTPPEANRALIADPQRLKQVLINLLNNAVKFTPQNGRVKLEVTPDAARKQIRFSVTDNGIGISPEDLLKLFQPFVQLDNKLSRQYPGTGLGLALVKHLVELQGGSVEVQSELGVGSCFAFILPWDLEQEIPRPAREVKNEPLKAGPLSLAKILIADDDKDTVLVLQDYLGIFGYQIVIAEDGRQVLPRVEELLPDIILMDIQMPYANGLDLTRRLRADPRFASIPIVALTAFAMPGDKERCLEAGMNDYLSKPVNLLELKNMIRGLVEPAAG